MTFLWTIISNDAVYVEMPSTLLGWLGWLALIAGVVIWAAKEWKAVRSMKQREWLWFAVLLVLTPFTALLLGFRLPSGQGLPPPGLPVVPQGPAVMLFLAVPWMIAGGVLGGIPATILALISGLLLALFDTHSAYTPIIYALLGLVFSALTRQRYRTWFYRLLRQPLVAMLLLPMVYAVLFLTAAAISGGDELIARLDYGMTHVGVNTLAVAGMALVGGIIGQILRTAFPKIWGDDTPLVPSPTETSLENRLLVSIAPVIILLVLALLIGTWVMAGNASRKMLEDRLSSTANVAAESMPFFLEAGQNLILQLADDSTLAASTPDEIYTSLSVKLRSVPYFRQLYYLDQYGNPVSGYPEKSFEGLEPSLEERTGIDLALKKVLVQTYTVPPQDGDKAAQISFIAAVQDDSGNIQGVLLGRSDLGANPFTQPVIQAIGSIQSLGGQGLIVDEDGKILFHTQSDLVMSQYEGALPETASFYDGTAADGTRELVYAQPVVGRSWTIVLTVPARMIQKQSYDIAVPLSGLILLLSLLTMVILRVGLRPVTASMRSLAAEAVRIADGQLDHPLPVQGADEVGQLRQAFEQMRVRLKDRLEEINLLLEVSQGVASSLDLETSVQPILKAALNNGASVARMVLPPEPSAELQSDMPDRVGAGAASEMYAGLDEPLLETSRQHSHIILTNLRRGRSLNLPSGTPTPASLIAVEMRHENRFYGTLWVGYDQQRNFDEEESRFVSMLASEGALAVANARLYTSAEVGRQRVEAILNSTPEPVLVTDRQGRLLLYNPAAMNVTGLAEKMIIGQPIEKVISQPELNQLFTQTGETHASREITLANSKVYYAVVSSVIVENQAVGKVCILRDITHFKELDAMKSDFVSTVSHDLRSPLTLVRGYTTMLQMVGDLSDQQKTYVQKIMTGVESMTRLVNNLLDLGRIEAGVGLQVEKVPINDLMERVFSGLQMQASQKQIQISLEPPGEDHPVVEADPALLQQALTNLVENAIKYTQQNGQIHIRAVMKPETVEFSVRDTGIGIAPIDQPRLFEKFYRAAQREAYSQRGTGLGLAIVKSIAERHGGKVWLDSQLGKGSNFHLEIPLSSPQTKKA